VAEAPNDDYFNGDDRSRPGLLAGEQFSAVLFAACVAPATIMFRPALTEASGRMPTGR
jgi:hypothetical protein